MNKEQTIAAGYGLHPTKHNMHRRLYGHDYSEPGKYLITIVTDPRRPLFGELITDPIAIHRSQLGKIIASQEIQKKSQIYPMIEIIRLCIMPDHMHMIIEVKDTIINAQTKKKKHLGHMVAGFKAGCSKAYWELQGSKTSGIFQEGYNDNVLRNNAQFHSWINYIEDNPRRLAQKRLHPEMFNTIYNIHIAGKGCQMIGNAYLLDVPEKMAVIVHGKDSDEDFDRALHAWLECGRRGGVIVGAFISRREKIVKNAAQAEGLRVIHLCKDGFPPLYKPAGKDFDACAEGALLQLSPHPEYFYDKSDIKRGQCLDLNDWAQAIASMPTTPRPTSLLKSHSNQR